MTKVVDLLTPKGELATMESIGAALAGLPPFIEEFGDDLDEVGPMLSSFVVGIQSAAVATSLSSGITLAVYAVEKLAELGWKMGVVDVEPDNPGSDGKR